jgi:hypothetical protein
MYRESIFGCIALTLAACGSAGQSANQPAAPDSGGIVYMMEQPADKELRTDVGGTIFKFTTVKDGGAAVPTELQYLGLAAEGRIKLRVLSPDPGANEIWRRRLRQEGYTPPASGTVDFEQDPAKPLLLEGFKLEILEAQASWIRYKITMPTGS